MSITYPKNTVKVIPSDWKSGRSLQTLPTLPWYYEMHHRGWEHDFELKYWFLPSGFNQPGLEGHFTYQQALFWEGLDF